MSSSIASLSLPLFLASAIAAIAWRERSDSAARSLRRWPVPMLVRASLACFALYLPFAWLVWFEDSAQYKRSLLLLWPIFPGLIPASVLPSLATGARLPAAIESWLAVAIIVAVFSLAIVGMRRSWWWCVGVAIALLALSSFISRIAYALARM